MTVIGELESELSAPTVRAGRWQGLLRPRIAIPTGILLACGIAAGVLLATGGEGAPTSPLPSPSPSETPSPSPSATPSPVVSIDANGRALPGFVTSDPSLPDALPLPPGIWAETGPGWVLATYRPSAETYDESTSTGTKEVTKQVIYLVSPAGVRYQVLELDVNQPLRIESWLAGSTHAIMRACNDLSCFLGAGDALDLDLTTGDLAPYPAPAHQATVFATLADGTRIWGATRDSSLYGGPARVERDGAFVLIADNWGPYSISPNGRFIAVSRFDEEVDNPGRGAFLAAVMSLSTLDVKPILGPAGDVSCSPGPWNNDGTLNLWCYNRTSQSREDYVVDPTSGESVATTVTDSFPKVSHDFWLGPDRWAGTYYPDEQSTDNDYDPEVGIDTMGTLTRLPIVDAAGVSLEATHVKGIANGVVFVEGQYTGTDGWDVELAIAYDAATGRQTVLIPAPPGGPTFGKVADYGTSVVGMTSWVIAP